LLSRGKKLLHVAPEGHLGTWLQSKRELDYVTADFHMDHVDYRIDLTKMPFSDMSFDAIICNHVLEHIPDDTKAMAELFRVLKRGGWVVLQVPISLSLDATYEDFSITDPGERERAFGQHDHVRIYGSDYVDRLKRVGFIVEPFCWYADNKAYGGDMNRFGLNERETVFFATRSRSSGGAPPLDAGLIDSHSAS